MRLCFRLVIGELLLASVVTGCRAADESLRTQPDATPIAAALDSCGLASTPGKRQDRQPIVSGTRTRWSGAVRSFPMFSLFIPDSAKATLTGGGAKGVTLAWPECPKCTFSVFIKPDSGIGLEARIASLVAEQRRIDSVNRDPNTVIHEFDEIDGPPVPFTTRAGRGYRIEDSCGDCTSTRLLLARPGYVAQIALGADDDTPDFVRHWCEMIVIGKTLTWR